MHRASEHDAADHSRGLYTVRSHSGSHSVLDERFRPVTHLTSLSARLVHPSLACAAGNLKDLPNAFVSTNAWDPLSSVHQPGR